MRFTLQRQQACSHHVDQCDNSYCPPQNNRKRKKKYVFGVDLDGRYPKLLCILRLAVLHDRRKTLLSPTQVSTRVYDNP